MKTFGTIPRCLFMVALLVCLTPLTVLAAAEGAEEEFPNAIGEVVFLMGNVAAQQADGTERELDLEKQVIPGDVIVTGKTGRVEIKLKDDSIFSQGPESSTSLDEFVYDGNPGASKMMFKMGLGTFRYVTGKIVQGNPDAFALVTPTTTIGIRGTEVFAVITPTQEEIGNLQLSPGHTMSVGNQQISRERESVTVDPKTGTISPPAPVKQTTVDEVLKAAPLTSKGELGPVGDNEEDLERKVTAFQNQIDISKTGLTGVDGRPDYSALHVISLQVDAQKTAEKDRDNGGAVGASDLGGGGGDGGGGGGY